MDLVRSYEDNKRTRVHLFKINLSGTHAYTAPLWEAKLHQTSKATRTSPTLYGSVFQCRILQISFFQQTYVYRTSECPKRNVGNWGGCISHFPRCITLIFIALNSPNQTFSRTATKFIFVWLFGATFAGRWIRREGWNCIATLGIKSWHFLISSFESL